MFSAQLPTRPGFYWWREMPTYTARMVKVLNHGSDDAPNLTAYDLTHHQWGGRTLSRWTDSKPVGEWAECVRPDAAPCLPTGTAEDYQRGPAEAQTGFAANPSGMTGKSIREAESATRLHWRERIKAIPETPASLTDASIAASVKAVGGHSYLIKP